MRRRAVLLSIVVILVACTTTGMNSDPLLEGSAIPTCQRFVSVPPVPPTSPPDFPWPGFLALDSKTGRLCSTVAWKIAPQNNVFNSLPECYSLYLADQPVPGKRTP